jgi:hypothetical protein
MRDVYRSYQGDGELHRARLFFEFFIAIVVGTFADHLAEKSFPVMSLAISVLTGFSFTALFSEPSVRLADLPAPANESDRQSISNLKKLSKNFRTRTNYFIALAIFQLVLMVGLTISLSLANIVEIVPKFIAFDRSKLAWCLVYIRKLVSFLYIVGWSLTFLAFMEWLYTFYRLSETILAILRVRTDYMESHQPSR